MTCRVEHCHYQIELKKRIPIAITNAEIPANKNADDSACL